MGFARSCKKLPPDRFYHISKLDLKLTLNSLVGLKLHSNKTRKKTALADVKDLIGLIQQTNTEKRKLACSFLFSLELIESLNGRPLNLVAGPGQLRWPVASSPTTETKTKTTTKATPPATSSAAKG
jgi:hypothetical protein